MLEGCSNCPRPASSYHSIVTHGDRVSFNVRTLRRQQNWLIFMVFAKESSIRTDGRTAPRTNCTRPYVESCHDGCMVRDPEQREIEQGLSDVQELATGRQFTRWSRR